MSMFDRCLYFNLNRLTRGVNRLWDDAYSELDLAPAHAYLLRLVLSKPGLLQKEIAEVLLLDKSTVTRFVDKMESQGYLYRAARDHDRRVGIYPTEDASAISERLDEIANEMNSAVNTLLGRESVNDLVALLQSCTTRL